MDIKAGPRKSGQPWAWVSGEEADAPPYPQPLGNRHGLHWVEDPGKQMKDTARFTVTSLKATRPEQGSHRQVNIRGPKAMVPGCFFHRAREEIWLRSGKNGGHGFGSGCDW